ncbi:MAG: preprotein translocase subunit SecE [Phycisphaerae bacterium]|nr:preprotein translocase subunit SecE [Phycisphaerae bacterium]
MAESSAAQSRTGNSFLEVYKRSQGFYTRVGTAIGAGILILSGGDFLHSQLAFDSNAVWTQWLQIGIPLVVVLIFAVLVWWLVGVYRRTCDFMIATEGEMKKVSWSSRSELIGSTKVVILFTAAMAIILFCVDVIFMTFFNSIDVLRGASPMEVLFGS